MDKGLKLMVLVIVLSFQNLAFGQLHTNKIFFTSQKDINPLNIQSTDIRSSFSLDEDVYGVLLANNTIEDLLPISQAYFYINTPEIPSLSEIRFKTPSRYINPVASYFVFPIIQHKKDENSRGDNAFKLMQHLNELNPGQHIIQVSLKDYDDVNFSSSFNLDVVKQSNDISSAPQINPKDRKKGYLEAGLQQSDYEKAILKLFNEHYPNQGFYRVIITSDNFLNHRKSSGRIKSRTLNADILSQRGGKCRAYDISVQQKKVGTAFGVYEIKDINGYYPFSCKDAR